MTDLINKLNKKADKEGYLSYPYAMLVDEEWVEGLIHIEYLSNYLKPYNTLDESIDNTKSEGLKLLLKDFRLLN